MKTKKKAPIIRIKGFDGDWEQRKLGEMLVSLQNNTFSRADLSNEKGVAKNVHYGDVLIKFGEVLDVSKEQLPMITDEKVLTKYKASFLKNGDVIVADTAEDITVGKCSEIAGLNDEVVLSGLHTIPYRPVEKFATGYLGYYLNSRAYHNQLIPLMQGIKVTSISKSAMQDTDIVYPKLLKEQAMIGNYFQSIDHLITLHQREIDRIVCLRKAMVEKMFPQNGADVPVVRFSRYKEPWRLCQFSEIFTERHIIDTISDEYPQLAFTIEEGVIRPEDKKTNKRDFLIIDKATKKYLQTEYDDIIYNPANVIYGAIHRNALGKGCVSPIYKIFYTDQDSTFMECIVRHPNFIKEISRSMEGTVKKLRTLKPKAFLEMSAYIAPTIEEQRQIGEYFRQMDRLIEIEKEELEKIKHIKSACLEKMFV